MTPEHGRARACVALAARQVKTPNVRSWLLCDERGTFEKYADEMLRKLPDTADAEHGVATVNEQVALYLAGLALQAAFNDAMDNNSGQPRAKRRR